MEKLKPFKPPKTIGACADALYETKQARLALQKQVDELEKRETLIKNHIIATLPKSQASGVAGRVARVTVVSKEVPQVENWDQLYAYVKKTGAFELLQRRLADAAIKERWDAGKKVPGVKTFTITTVSLNKL